MSRRSSLVTLVRRAGVVVLTAATIAVGSPAFAPAVSAAPPAPPVGELPDRRTPTSKTVRNADGSFTTTLFSGRVHYADQNGAMQPIRSELVASDRAGYGWRNRANSFGAHFRDSLGDDFLLFDVGGRDYSLSLQGAASRPARADGARLGYGQALPGVDLDYEVSADGVKETLVLASAAAPTTYRFFLTPSAGTPVSAARLPDGSWAFYAAPSGSPVFVLAAPRAVDSAPERQADAEAASNATLDVRRAGAKFQLDLRLDGAWLRDPARVFPVLLDPTITVQPTVEDTSFAASCANCTPFSSDRLYMGASDTNTWRAALQFDLGAIPASANVSSAQLGLFFDGYCMSATGPFCGGTSHQIDAHRMTKTWSTATTTVNTAFDPAVASSFTLPAGAASQWMSWTSTSLVQNWLSGALPNYGFLLKRATEPTSSSGPTPPGRRFTEPSVQPKLDVTYVSEGVSLDVPSTLHSNGADLRWSRFDTSTGAVFQKYEVHRSPNAVFTPTAQTLLTTITDIETRSFRDTTAAPLKTFSYKVVANTSASNGRTVTLPADGQATKLVQPDPAVGKSTFIADFTGTTNCANYGAEDRLSVGPQSNAIKRSLVGFDVRDIPAGATINSATMSLWQVFTSPAVATTLRAHRVTRAWDEGTGKTQCTSDGATWFDSQGGTRWTTNGGDYDATAAATISKAASTGPKWDDYDLTTAVRQWVSGAAPNHGVVLRMGDETLADRSIYYHSDDYTAAPGLRPKLNVTYADGSKAIAPTVAVASPGAGTTVTGTATIEAAASDDRRVDLVQFLVNGVVVGSDSTAPFSYAWNSASVGNAAHSVSARATDDAGNVTTSAAVTVTVDNTPLPAVSVTAPTAGASVIGTVTVSANATDDQGISRVEFYFDNQRFAEDTVAPYSVSWNTKDAVLPAYDGTRVITARAYSNGGQAATSAAVNVAVNNTSGTKYKATYTSTLVPQEVPYDAAAASQEQQLVDVTVTNTSAFAWDYTKVKMLYQWKTPNSSTATGTNTFALTSNVAAGASRTVRVAVNPPPLGDGIDRKQYRLEVDLQEWDGKNNTIPRTFGSYGNAPLDNPVIVNKKLKAALGLERYYQYVGEETGAGMQHLVNVANGNSLLRWTPIASPGRGLSTVFDLTYNSLEDKSDSPIGNNFSLSISSLTRLGLPLDVHPNNADTISGRANRWVAFTDGDGTTHRFEGKQAADGTVYWEEPPGVHLYLRTFSTTDATRRWALTRPDRVTYFYDADGYPTSVEDKNGNRLAFTLENIPPGEDPGGPKKRVIAITDAAGLDATPAPNRVFRIDYYSKAEAPKAHVRGRIQRITDHTGSAWDFDYYDDGNLLRITQRGGVKADGAFLADRTFVFTYTNSAGDAAAITDPALRANPEPKTPNQSTRLYSVRDPRGTETRFAYYGPTSGQLRWKLESRTNRLGNVTSFAYDLAALRTTVTAPLSRVTSYGYDTDGKVTSITNPKSETTTVAWTPHFHVAKVTEPTGKFQEFAYNDNGYLTDRWDELRNRTALAYENVAIDGNDVTGKWKAGRTIPHVSQVSRRTEPRGTATTTAGDFEWQFAYDAKGNVLRVTDPGNNVTTNAYTSTGLVASVTDALNRVTSYAYDANGKPSQVTNGNNEISKLGYDDDGLLRWIQDARHASDTGAAPRDYRTYFDYDSFHRMGRQSAPKSTATERGMLLWSSVDFDANDNTVSKIAPHYGTSYGGTGARTTMAYDLMDQLTLVTGPDREVDPAGERTKYEYDAAGRTTKVTAAKGVASTNSDLDHSVVTEFDVLDRVAREKRFEVSDTGTLVRTLVTHACYDLAGDVVSVTAPKAALATVDCASATTPYTTRYTYDATHRRLSEKSPNNMTKSRTYDANGNVATLTNENNDTETREYDVRDLLVKVTSPFVTGTTPRTLVTKIEYDAVGNRKRVVSPRAWDASTDKVTFAQYVTTYNYDAANRVTRVDLPTSTAYPTPHFIHRAYDANGNAKTVSLADTNSLLSGVPADKLTTTTFFDPGWARTIKAPGVPKSHVDYTAEGLQSTRTPEDKNGALDNAKTMTWTYFLDTMLKERKDKGGQVTTYKYDANNKLVSATNAGGLVSEKESAVDLEVTYNSLARTVETRHKKKSQANWTFTSYAHDLNGNVADREDSGEETTANALVKAGRKHHFDYDQGDWLTQHLDYGKETGTTDDQRITNTFAPTGWERTRLIEKSNGAGGWTTKQSTAWTHFANGKLKTLSTKNNSGVVIESHDVSYTDPANIYANGHRTKDVYILQGPNTAPCRSTTCTATYTYDARDRLVKEQNARGSTSSTDYTLDPAGNVTREVRTGASGTTTRDYTFTGTQMKTASSGGATQNYFYDHDGNLDCVTLATGSQGDCGASTGGSPSAQVLADYSYDYLSRLSDYRSYVTNGTSSSADDTSSYVYDALDRVSEQTEKHGSSPQRTSQFSYLNLGSRMIEEKQKDAAGALTKTKSFSYDAFGHRIGMTDTPGSGGTPEIYTYGYDVHGSVSQLVTESGTVKASYGYKAYGEQDSEVSQGDTDPDNPTNPFRYTGKRYDSGSGTLDMGARRFGPDVGRFLQADSYNGALADLALSNDPLTANRYSLAGGNPISFVEVDGHMVIADGGGGGSTTATPTSGTSGDSDNSGYYTPREFTWSHQWSTFKEDNKPWRAANAAGLGLSFGEGAIKQQGRNYWHTRMAQAESFWARSMRPSSSLVGRMPVIRSVRSGWYDMRGNMTARTADAWKGVTGKVAGGLQVAGLGLAAYDSFTGQWDEDSSRSDLSTGEKVGRATVKAGFSTAGAYIGGTLAAGACASTGVGAIAAGLCGAVGGAVGQAVGGVAGELAIGAADWVSENADDVAEDIGGALESAGEAIGGLFD